MGQGSSTTSSSSVASSSLLALVETAKINTDDIHKNNRDAQLFDVAMIPSEKQDLTLVLSDQSLSCVFQKLSAKDLNSVSRVCKRWHTVEAKSRNRLTLRAEAALEATVVCLLTRFEYVACLSLKCGRREASIDDKCLLLIGQHCKFLSRLKLKGCKAISDEGIERFAKVCGYLKKFSCGSCGFGSRGLNLLLKNCSTIDDLSIKHLRKLRENPEAILPGNCSLRRLCLKEITSAHLFGTLITESKHIQILVIARSPGLWDQFFELISVHILELVELHVDNLNMGDVALKAISRCSKLEVFHVAKAFDCSDYGYGFIANGCRRLRKLHIDNRRTGRVGDEGLMAIGKCCTDLQELVLIGVNVTVRSLAEVALNCVGLERMALCNSDTVGDRELYCLADRCLALKKLCIKNCPISDLGLEGFARGCPSLSKVKVKKCKDITWASATWLQMNRSSLVVSLDSPLDVFQAEVNEETFPGPDVKIMQESTSQFCNRPPFVRTRLVLAATNFLRGFPRLSGNS